MQMGKGSWINLQNARMVLRGRYDAQLYTNDKTHLAGTLSREVSPQFAVEPTRTVGPARAQNAGTPASLTQERQRTIEQNLSPGR